jgi:hypothetical protein
MLDRMHDEVPLASAQRTQDRERHIAANRRYVEAWLRCPLLAVGDPPSLVQLRHELAGVVASTSNRFAPAHHSGDPSSIRWFMLPRIG